MAPNDKELIPGTEVIFRDGNLSTDSRIGDLVLIPQPSENLNDPLNWSPTWKIIVIVNQFVFVFVSIMTPLCIAPMTLILEAEFHKTLPEVNMLFGAAAITLGYANFIIVPCANVVGRRPVIAICGLICVLANVWQACATSYPSLIGARVISGVGAAANESIMPMVVADMLFVHQRGRSTALYFWAYFMGLFIGPIISGAVASQISWRWFFWICTILQAVSLIFIVVAHPETKYQRYTHSATATAGATLPGSISAKAHESGERVPSSLIWRDILSPLRILFLYPIVTWASLAMGFAANSLLALNLTQAQVFGAPHPYGFTPDQIGFVNFSFVVGAAIALVTAGPLSDYIALRSARSNGGVLEAEMRLPALIPYVVVNLVGMVITAVGYQRSWPWPAIVVVGYGLVGVQVVGIPTIAIAYAVDCYKALPGEVMIAATVVKNTFGFGMIFFYNDWAARSGYIAPVLLLMALTVGFSVLGLAVFIPFGKQFRRWTKDSKLHAL
ncbi:major facilitator superfamily domain-containing protein [Microdochium trichocladiopsis]|uniref:Major facilitator superfamily domain-containing protein n=1 Tax=Microdochium trichocladiopsis TaxID=1682393 RepID=A0A9P9BR46_9PEZI|nr:major facilitator superfamily domain-containing protein [Microdochium trichocladiopsis]KAH7031562.1 major facilitator superfamily domain-containing protein [Microdochium trichocladiopsis]